MKDPAERPVETREDIFWQVTWTSPTVPTTRHRRKSRSPFLYDDDHARLPAESPTIMNAGKADGL
jgi:hypothetical protein